ncbi:single-strand binding protein/Primosomal replication protein n, partial [Clostridium sartagoforme AAU1]
MNRVTLIGNVVKDLELKNYNSSDGNGSYVQFTLAINDQRNKDKEAVFISIVSFGKQAEILSKYLSKGRRI